MMNPLKNVAPALARTWVQLYTRGMPHDLCEARRAEVNVDLWEHLQDPEVGRESGTSIAMEILLRTLLGIPDDIGWRLEAVRERRRAVSKGRKRTMAISIEQMRRMGLGALLAGALMIAIRLVDMLFEHPGRIVSPSGNSLRFVGTLGASILVILSVVALLSTLAVLGLKVHRRGHTGKSGSAGFALLLAGFASITAASALNASAIAFDFTDPPAVWALVSLLSIPAYALLIPLGFLLVGVGLPDPSRRVLLVVGSYLVVQPWVGAVLRNRLPTVGVLFGSEMSSIVLALGVAGIGYALWSGTRAMPALEPNL